MGTNPTDEVVQLFLGTPESPEEAAELELGLKAATLRLPALRMFWVEAMAEHAGLSRNAMLQELVRVGISSVLGSLPDPIREQIGDDVHERHAAAIDGGAR